MGAVDKLNVIINLGGLSNIAIGVTSFRLWLMQILKRGVVTGGVKRKAMSASR